MDQQLGRINKNTRDYVRNYIDSTLVAVLDELSSPDGHPTITLKRRSRKSGYYISPRNGALKAKETDKYVSYMWPGKDAHEVWRFSEEPKLLSTACAHAVSTVSNTLSSAVAVSFRILAAISEAINSGLVVSKRDIYYSDPICFGSQRVVDLAVDDIAYTIGVDRAALNVEAAAKGLVVGYFRLARSNEAIDGRISTADILIPSIEDIQGIEMQEVKWVLIIEKEAVYRRLAKSRYYVRAAAGKGILITGKGYPDISTRAFARYLYEKSLHDHQSTAPRFYTLVDNDPDGMAIQSTYKFGSMAHAHENEKFNIPKLEFLGLSTSDIVAGADSLGDDAVIPLSARDRRKIIAMLTNNPVWAVDGPEPEWRAELQRMLMLNVKAETEILYQREDGLEGWVDQKMLNRI